MAVKISNTIKEFRQDTLSRGGPQISSMYKVELVHHGDVMTCYPMSVWISLSYQNCSRGWAGRGRVCGRDAGAR
jgi:hypothetical protein